MNKVFIYARKSTDEPDKQILSIESQLHELHKECTDNMSTWISLLPSYRFNVSRKFEVVNRTVL